MGGIDGMSEITYECKENDNAIRISDKCGDVELLIGCPSAPSYGWNVIGINDLREALKLAGYSIVPLE
jgi:hypothetical protein